MASSKQGDNNAGRRGANAGNQSSSSESGNETGSTAGNMMGNKTGNKQGGDTSSRGFASMDPARQREIAAQGGRAAHQKGTAHEFTPEEARRAGSMSHKNSQSARDADSQATSASRQSSQQDSQQDSQQRQGEPDKH